MLNRKISYRFAIIVIAITAIAALSFAATSHGSFGLFAPNDATAEAATSALAPAIADDDSLAPTAAVTTNGGSGLAGTYPTLAAAITALNGATITSPVIINVTGTETAPAGGYSITATGTAVNTIIINGGGGATTTITASPALTVGVLNDSIFKIIGGDFITIDGFTMLENAGNTVTAATTNTMTEWGVALLYATTTNGAQNDTIQNNTITLNRTYQNTFGIYSNSTHSATAITSATATTTAGGNSVLKVYGNTINNVNQGIVVVGPTAAADANTGIDIGGAGGAQANSITNFGTTGTFSAYANVSGTVNGILVRNSNGSNISFNTVTSSVGGTTVGTLNGIQIPAASTAPTTAFTTTVSNNNISLQSAVVAGSIVGITQPSGSASTLSSFVASNNNFNTFGHTVAAASGAITFITSASTHLNNTISNNTFTNLNLTTTGSVTFISNSVTVPAGGSQTINGNSIVTAFNKTGAGGTVTGITTGGSSTTVTSNWNTNNFSNMTVTGATAITFINQTDGGTVNHTITGNTLNNITGGTSAIIGINSSFGGGNGGNGNLVSGNTVSNITSAGAISGITIGGSGTTSNVSSNTIFGLSTSGAVAVTGISSAAPVSASIFKNKIYDLTGGTANPAANGILVTAGTSTTVFNNLIGNLTAPTATLDDSIRGIGITSTTITSAVNVYFNTVYINATTGGANFGSTGIFHAASATATTATLSLRNNIIVNTSVHNGSGSTVAYRRSNGVAGTLANYASTSNNNDFYAGPVPSATNAIYNDATSIANTISAYKNGVFTAGTIAPRDSASVSENPPFLSTTGSSANFLHINTLTATQIESGAATISGFTDDFDGDTRNVTTPDIGADEFTGTPQDLTAPSITYTALAGTASLANRNLTATITDASGVASGANSPRIYFKKSTDAGYVSTQCTGTSPTYTCTINYTLVGGGSVTAADIIQYFVVAQDTAGNVGANPSGGFAATSVNTVTSPPTTPNSYTILGSISGIKNVGAGGDYATLTLAVADLNSKEITGAVVLTLTDASYSAGETFPLTINANNGSSASNTVTIKPASGVSPTISGSSASCVIGFNGADFMTIDGSNSMGGTTRDLTITNTNAGTSSAVVCLQSTAALDGATSDVVKNTNIVGNTNITTLFGVFSGSQTIGTTSLGTGNNTNTIQNNNLSKTQFGIFSQGASAANKNTGNVITQNLINSVSPNNAAKGGIITGFENNLQVTQNNVSEIVQTSSPDVFGISLGIQGISTTAFTGNEVTNATVSRNLVGSIRNTGTFSACGICVAPATSGTNQISNNSVAGVSANGTSGDFSVGILIGGGSGSTSQIYYNSVSMTGTQTGGSDKSFALAIGGTDPIVDVRNNALYNTQNNGTGSNYAIAFGYATFVNLTSNFNDLYVTSPSAIHFVGATGSLSTPTNQATLANLQTATGKDANSLSVDPLFMSVTDLHLQSGSTLINAGTTIAGITIDIDGDVRPSGPAPDIGSDEVFVPAVPGTVQFSSVNYAGNEGTTATIVVTRTAGNVGAISVNYATSNGTAIAGTCGTNDYVAASGTLNWADMDSTFKTFTVALCSDAVLDPAETVNLTLSGQTAGVIIGANNPAVLTIGDIPPPFNGTYTVGTGGTFASLTNTGGIFESINTAGASGPVTINILSDLTGETGTVALNQIAGGFTVTIQPSGGARLISGTNATALIDFNGADNVTVDGLNTGGNSLIIRNTGAGAAIRFINDASNNIVRNNQIEGGSGSTLINIASGTTTGNDNIQIVNNIIRDQTAGGTNVPFNGVGSTATSLTVTNTNLLIDNNQIINFTQAGVFVGLGTDNITVTNNNISQTGARTTALTGIVVNGVLGTNLFSLNTIHDLSTTLASTGINLNDARATTVSRNRIYNLSTLGSASTLTGIVFNGSSANPSAVTIVNNMVSIVPVFTNAQTIYGIRDFGFGGNTFSAYFNSVLISGTGSGTSSTFACERGAGSPTVSTWNDNICFNNRTGGTGNHFAIGDESGGTGTWVSNYNIFVGTGATAANFFSYNAAAVSFAAWPTGPPTRDANSQASNPGGNYTVANIFVSDTDLHLNTAGTNPAINAGIAAGGITVDFDGQTRDAMLDIGADEIIAAAAPTIMVSPTSLTNFGTVTVGSNSASQNYTVSGSNLTANIVVTAPSTDFQVSLDNVTFSNSVTVTQTGGTASATISVRFTPQSPGAKSGNVTNASTGATTQNVAVSGTGAAANTPPTIAAVGVTRQSGSPSSNSTIANVTDAESGNGAVVVTVTSANPSNGVTVSTIVNTSGIITADVVAACGATSTSFTLQASDGSLTATSTLNVTVNANAAPTLTYSNASVASGGSTTNSPATGPSDNGSVSTIVVQSAGTYTGTISVNNSTGVVSVSGAAPIGVHTITIRATDNCGLTTDATFSLTVGNNPPVITAGGPLSRQKGSAGTTSTIATVSDPDQSAGSLVVTATTVPAGITVTSITNTAGTVMATVTADCSATVGADTVVLTVTDANSGTSTANLTVNVTANTAPTLTYSNASVATGGSTTINPTTGPTDNGSIASIVVQSAGTYTGTISVNNAGVVSISGAAPAGMHTITIRATDNCSLTTDATFVLTVSAGDVTAPVITYTPLPNTFSNANPTLHPIITDAVGVTAATIFFSVNAAPFTSTPCMFASGTAQSGTWDCFISGSLPSPATITYYVTAQDAAANMASNPTAGAAVPNLYTIASPVIPAGSYTNVSVNFGTTFAGNASVAEVLTLGGIIDTGANTLTLGCNATVSGAGLNNYVVGNVKKDFCTLGTFTYPVGTPQDNMIVGQAKVPEGGFSEYSPFTANVTALGIVPSSLTVSVTDGVLAGSDPLQSASRYWNVTETGDLTADISYTYLIQDIAGIEEAYRVLRRAGVVTTVFVGGTVNGATHTATAPGVINFSSWGAGILSTTASGVSVAGRVTTTDGRGIKNVSVVVSGNRLPQPVRAITGPFGYYQIDDLEAGETYIVTVNSKRFAFRVPSRVITLTDNILDVDFVAEPR